MDKKLEYQLDGLRVGVLLYAPLLMYIFLKRRESHLSDSKTDIDLTKLAGRSVNNWPKEIQEDFEKLFESKEKLILLQREFIYFLIFIYFGYSVDYLKKEDENKRKTILDYLFGIFENPNAPWLKELDSNAYDKYAIPGNDCFLIFMKEISRITSEDDAFFLHNFVTEITGISKFLIKPSVDKLFSEE